MDSVRDYQLGANYIVGDFLRAKLRGKLHWWHKPTARA